MSRWLLAALCAVSIFTYAPELYATELTSSTATIYDIGDPFSFDFTGDPDLATVEVTDKLLGVRVDWQFIPGGSNYSDFKLRAKLILMEMDSGTGFDVLINGSPAMVPAFAENYSTSLTFGTEVINELLGGTYGKLEGVLRILSQNIPELVQFFEDGGSLQATLTLITNSDGGPGGSGDPVPEPASILLWGLLGAAGLSYRRYRRSLS